jgi:hypothetical protein
MKNATVHRPLEVCGRTLPSAAPGVLETEAGVCEYGACYTDVQDPISGPISGGADMAEASHERLVSSDSHVTVTHDAVKAHLATKFHADYDRAVDKVGGGVATRRGQNQMPFSFEGVRHATAHSRFQITTDGFGPYKSAISNTLHDRCDFAQLIKVYRSPQDGEKRYSPAEVSHAEKVPVMGNPDPAMICTSHVERQNLTIRMQMRRLTRLTNAFSKKLENLWAAYCLHFAYYNFCRIHKTLRVSPAMESSLADQVWELAELVA